MDSSSDESFSWRKISTGSDDSDDRVNSKEVTPKKQSQPDIKLNSESPNKPKAKKRNLKNESHDTEDIHSPKKKRIKIEPESDCDAVKKKSLNKSNITQALKTFEEDAFLNLQVKQEKEHYFNTLSDEKLVKNKTLSKASESIDNYEKESKQNGKIKKEKKSKKNKQVCYQESSIIENISVNKDSILNGVHTDTDTEVIGHKNSKKKKSKRISFNEQNEIVDEHEGSSLQKTEILVDTDNVEVINKSLKKKKSKENRLSINGEDKFTAEETVVEKREKLVTTTEKIDFKTKRTSRLSDRIRFEGETDSEKDIAKENSSSSVLKKIQNENLQPVSLQENSVITDKDEIWIFKCPHDSDINKLNNLNLDGKCKFKISGETYCGVSQDRYPTNIVTSIKQEKKIIRKLPNDIIHFKKRTPKQHFCEDNVMVNNQTNFIPLPETKSRHPLFGSNYKDYINLPTRSLNSSSKALDLSSSCDKKKKKKHKKECQLETEIQTTIKMDPEVSSIKVPKTELDSDVPVKKHKKHKHTDDEKNTRKKSKRTKIELNSADAWESEKAIEENLFNF